MQDFLICPLSVSACPPPRPPCEQSHALQQSRRGGQARRAGREPVADSPRRVRGLSLSKAGEAGGEETDKTQSDFVGNLFRL